MQVQLEGKFEGGGGRREGFGETEWFRYRANGCEYAVCLNVYLN